MRADRIFFSGGEPAIHLPYIEKVVADARKIKSKTKVNFDTNGYMTGKSLQRILNFTTSITFDLKAYRNETHLALTGAYASPVLRNAEYIARHARNKLWEYRVVVVPKINEAEIQPLAEFIASIDPTLPVCFLAFRPNFVFENHPGATLRLMDRCIQIAEQSGLKNAYWSGHAGLAGRVVNIDFKMKQSYRSNEAQLAGSYAQDAGCRTHPRNCRMCPSNLECKLKRYTPQRST